MRHLAVFSAFLLGLLVFSGPSFGQSGSGQMAPNGSFRIVPLDQADYNALAGLSTGWSYMPWTIDVDYGANGVDVTLDLENKKMYYWVDGCPASSIVTNADVIGNDCGTGHWGRLLKTARTHPYTSTNGQVGTLTHTTTYYGKVQIFSGFPWFALIDSATLAAESIYGNPEDVFRFVAD